MVRTKALRVPVRVVFYREDGEWVAHCLEFDLIGDGTTKQEALSRLAISIQVEAALDDDNMVFCDVCRGTDVANGVLELDLPPPGSTSMIDAIEVREYQQSESAFILCLESKTALEIAQLRSAN